MSDTGRRRLEKKATTGPVWGAGYSRGGQRQEIKVGWAQSEEKRGENYQNNL